MFCVHGKVNGYAALCQRMDKACCFFFNEREFNLDTERVGSEFITRMFSMGRNRMYDAS